MKKYAAALAGVALAAGVAVQQAPLAEAAPPAPSRVPAAATVQLRINVDGCEGCDIHLTEARTDFDSVWQAPTKRVHDGHVTFLVPRARTHGMSMSVLPPWERSTTHGSTGYLTLASFRYGGESAGQRIGLAEARTKRTGASCWGGTSTSNRTLRLHVRKQTVAGTTGPVTGSIAWISPAANSWAPMTRTAQGILGSQAIPYCQRP